MALEVELFLPIEKPLVRFFGAAADARGHQLANIVEFTSSKYHYLVVIELPQVQCCDDDIEWSVSDSSEVTIEGQITAGATFANTPLVHKRKRNQLCPTEPWGMSFYFPGPVDWWTSSVLFMSKSIMEISVRRGVPEPEPGPASPTASETDEMVDGWFV